MYYSVHDDKNNLSRGISNKKLYKYHIFFAIFTFVLIAVGLYIYKTPVVEIIKYLYFQVFFIIFPGMFIYRLLRIKGNITEKLVMSYGFGVVLTIIAYILFFTINARILLIYMGPVLSLIEVYLMVYSIKNKKNRLAIVSDSPSFTVLTIASLLSIITFFGFTFANPLFQNVKFAVYNQDLLWNIGNIESILKSVIPSDLRLSGVVLKYHYFLSVHLAAMSFVTNIDPVELFFRFSQIGKIYFLVFSTYILGKNFLKNQKKAVFFTWIFFFTACASMWASYKNGYGLFLNINFVHLTDDPFGYELSIAFLFLCVSLILKQYRNQKFHPGLFIGTGLFMFGCTGTKGTIGIMVIGVFLVIFLILFFKRTVDKRMIAYTALIGTVFIILYFTIFPGGGELLGVAPGYTVTSTVLGTIINKIISNKLERESLYILSIPIHFILFIPFAAVPFLLWFYNKVKFFKDTKFDELLSGGLALCGILAAYLFKQDGQSQLYFIMVSIPFIELCAIEWLSLNYKALSKIYKYIIMVSFIVATVTSLCTGIYEVKSGFVGLSKVRNVSLEVPKPEANGITLYEYEAMNWIKCNTPSNAVIASDRWYIDNGKTPRFFYYSVFSDRQFFLEGWDYVYTKDTAEVKDVVVKDKLAINRELVSSSTSDRAAIMKKYGINYLVISHFEEDDPKTGNNHLSLVFKNRDVSIYKADN